MNAPRRGLSLGAVIFLMVCALGFCGGAAFLLWRQNSGPEAQVTVRECRTSRRSHVCYGTWMTGSILDGGRFQRGIVEGATKDDIGAPVTARIHGERAYVRDLRTPIILFVLGAAIQVWVAYSIVFGARARPR